MSPTPLFTYIQQYIDLSEEDRDVMSQHLKHRKYLKHQVIVQQGDVCRYESFIIKGAVKTFFVDQQGQEHIVMFGIENWWVADLGSFINQTPADFNVQCLEDTEVIQFSHESLEELYRLIPRLERFFRIIIQKAFVASQNRIVRNLSLPAKERYLLFRDQYPEIEQRAPQYMIASYLSITKEFLSKIRSQLLN